MTDKPTLRERADEGARDGLCLYDRTDGFCRGRDAPDCPRCANLGRQIAHSVLMSIRPTMRRLLAERDDPNNLPPDDVLALIDEAINERPPISARRQEKG